MNRGLLVAALVNAVLTFVGIVLASPSAAKVIAVVGTVITGGCLRGWVLIRRRQDV